MKPTSYIADFDSATGMLRALANYLHGRDFPLLGAIPKWRSPGMKLMANVVNSMPDQIKEQVYIWSGRYEAIAARKLDKAKTDRIANGQAACIRSVNIRQWRSDHRMEP